MDASKVRRLNQLAWLAWSIALFLLPFNKFGGLRNTAFVVLLVSLLGLWRMTPVDRRAGKSTGLVLGGLIVLWAAFVSAVGPYPADSLHAISKDLLVHLLLVAAAWRLVRTESDVRRSLLVALAGFVTVSVLSFGEILASGISTLFSATIEQASARGHGAFWGGYAASASVYLPLLIGVAVLLPMRAWWRVGVIVLILFSLLLMVLYGSRSAVLVVAFAAVVGFLVARRYRMLLALAALLGVLLIGFYSQADLGYLNKYKSLSNPATYVTNQGLSMRLSVWQGAVEVIRERPWLGFGYGWKKLAWAINDGGFASRWRAESPDLAQYYLGDADTASYGRVNPHNYSLQVIFEIGVIGFALVLAFWGVVLGACVRLVRHGPPAIGRWGGVLLLTLVGYFLSNINNGYWVGGVANLAVAIAGMVLALHDEGAKA